MPFVLNPNALKEIHMKWSIFYCRWGEKPNWPWNLIDYPQPTSHVYWNPNCPLVKRKEKNVQEQINILQTNSKLFYAYTDSSLFIFCANEEAATNSSRALFLWLVWPSAPPFSSGIVCLFPVQPVDCCPSWCRCWHPRAARGRGVRGAGWRGGEACTQQQARGRHELGKLSGRWETKVGDRWFSMLLYLAVYNSRLFLLWWSFLT